MRITEKLTKPVREAKYLNVENTGRYRSIIRLFFMYYEKLKYWMYQEEVYEELIEDPYFVGYTMEQCQLDLSTLVSWGNLMTIQDTRKVTTIDEFKNKKFRYQLSEYAVEIERMVVHLENLFVEGASLEPTLLERIRHHFSRISSLSQETDERLYGWWSDLKNDFVRLNQNYQDYMRTLNSVKAEEMMQTQAFLAFKDRLIEYLRGFVKSLQVNQAISSVLAGIGVDCTKNENSTGIDAKGNYRLGVLEGNVSGNYQSRFIGATARERYRTEQIAKLQEQRDALQAEVERLQGLLEEQENALNQMKQEESSMPSEKGVVSVAQELSQAEHQLKNIQQDIGRKEAFLAEQRKELEIVRLEVQEVCAKAYLTIRLDVFENAMETLKEYESYFQRVKNDYVRYLSGRTLEKEYAEQLEKIEMDLDEIRYEIGQMNTQRKKAEAKLTSVRQQMELSDYRQLEERLNHCIKRLGELPRQREKSVTRQAQLAKDMERLGEQLEQNKERLQQIQKKTKQLELVFVKEYELGYVVKLQDNEEHMGLARDSEKGTDEESDKLLRGIEMLSGENPQKLAKIIEKRLEGQMTSQSMEDLNGRVQEVFHENKGYLSEHRITIQTVFEELKEECDLLSVKITRLDIRAKYRGMAVSFSELLEKLRADAEMQERLLSDKDKELFEDILANTISKKIRAKIHASKRWVKNMNELMESMQTSSGLRLSLKWKSKRAEKEEQLDTRELVELLEQDAEILQEAEIEKMSMHFRSKIAEARKSLENQGNVQSFHMIMREILDYRQWFEFCLECQKTGEKKKELTDRVFFTFSGGEKAMAMYVPLFSAVVAKYSGAREDAPRLISLDEAFAGVDEMNIKDIKSKKQRLQIFVQHVG